MKYKSTGFTRAIVSKALNLVLN